MAYNVIYYQTMFTTLHASLHSDEVITIITK